MRISIKKLVFCALFAALTAVCAQISIPLPAGVPISFATFAVMLSGGLLGGVGGALSQIVYLLLGVVGIPVFAGFHGGIGCIVGPTGGYVVGYVFMAFVIGVMIPRHGKTFAGVTLSLIAGTAVCYLCGTVWFMIVTESTLIPALMGGVLPFLPGEAVKILLALFCISRMRASHAALFRQ